MCQIREEEESEDVYGQMEIGGGKRRGIKGKYGTQDER